jgi:thiamine biosynthesis lipoprotein
VAPEPVESPAVPVATQYWQRIEVRPGLGGAQVRIPKGCQLDLGAIAKAWLADHLAERLVDGWDFDAIANMGGDIRAVGLSQAWTIEADPQLDGWPPMAMTVTDSGLATSGQGLRRWTTPSGGIGHHIIDPRTGRPAATPWWTASVLAADARDANTASTAAMVLGHSAADWLTAHGLDAWLVPAPGHDRTEARVLGRWPQSKEVIR